MTAADHRRRAAALDAVCEELAGPLYVAAVSTVSFAVMSTWHAGMRWAVFASALVMAGGWAVRRGLRRRALDHHARAAEADAWEQTTTTVHHREAHRITWHRR